MTNFNKGDRVTIMPSGEVGIIRTRFTNGAIVERDGSAPRRFITVKFENLKLIKPVKPAGAKK